MSFHSSREGTGQANWEGTIESSESDEITPDSDGLPKFAMSAEDTNFGFRRVPPREKSRLVRRLFGRVAQRYDVMNDLMSAGVHRLWKADMIAWLRPRPNYNVVDVAGGTGDIAQRLSRCVPEGRIVVCDVSAEMLSCGRDRALNHGFGGGITWTCGDAESLPFADSTFDAYTIAFGIRNVAGIDRALREARRVLRPGGRFLCLEFGRVAAGGLARLYDIYSFNVVPWLGDVVAGDRAAYVYLVESIRRFPEQNQFAAMIENAGFGRVGIHDLSGGIAALHSAWRI